jgi:hypothetical protein
VADKMVSDYEDPSSPSTIHPMSLRPTAMGTSRKALPATAAAPRCWPKSIRLAQRQVFGRMPCYRATPTTTSVSQDAPTDANQTVPYGTAL